MPEMFNNYNRDYAQVNARELADLLAKSHSSLDRCTRKRPAKTQA